MDDQRGQRRPPNAPEPRPLTKKPAPPPSKRRPTAEPAFSIWMLPEAVAELEQLLRGAPESDPDEPSDIGCGFSATDVEPLCGAATAVAAIAGLAIGATAGACWWRWRR